MNGNSSAVKKLQCRSKKLQQIVVNGNSNAAKKLERRSKNLQQIVVNGNGSAVKKLQYRSSQQYRLQHHAVNNNSTSVKIPPGCTTINGIAVKRLQ